ncbi:MAG TPA: HEAT repeat domain-containing protein [Pirellulales bacterium]|jgi:HEAT repeat protein
MMTSPDKWLLHADEAVRSLQSIGLAPAVPEFSKAVQSLNGTKRVVAAVSLLYFRKHRPDLIEKELAATAEAAVHDALMSEDVDGLRMATSMLCHSGLVPAGAVAALKLRMRHGDKHVRTAAAGALSTTPKFGLRLLRILEQALNSGEDTLISLAAAALARIEFKDRTSDAINFLTAALPNASPVAQCAIISTFGRMGNVARSVVPVLRGMMIDEQVHVAVRSSIATCFGEFSRSVRGVEEALFEALVSDDWEVVSSAAIALRKPGIKMPANAVKLLIKRLGSEDRNIRGVAARALCDLKEQIAIAISALVSRLLVETDDEVLEVIVESLGVAGKTAIPELISALRKSDVRTRQPIGIALVHIGKTTAREVAQAIVDVDDPIVQQTLASVLYLMGPQALPAVPILITAIERGDDNRRRCAVMALAAIGPGGQDAVPALLALLKNADDDLGGWIEKALASIGNEAIPMIAEYQTSTEPSMQRHLQRITTRLGASQAPCTETRLSALRDDRLLEFFAIVADIINNGGPSTNRGLAICLSERKKNGTLPLGVSCSDAYVGTALKRLEKLVGKSKGKASVHLIERGASRQKKGGLTQAGRDLFAEIEKYRAAKRRHAENRVRD